jgi:hypothetical protein
LGVGDWAFAARGTIRQAAKAAALSLIWIVISSYFSSPGDESLGSRPGDPYCLEYVTTGISRTRFRG